MKFPALLAAFIMCAAIASAQEPAQPSTTPSTKPSAAPTEPEPKPERPVLDAAIGPCAADFQVKDAAGKPVYAAKVHTLIRYGAFGVKKQELQVSTDYNGEARITGLPDVNKRPITFDVSKGLATSVLTFDPGNECHPHYNVVLK